MNRVRPADHPAEERRVVADIGILHPVDEPRRELGGKDGGGELCKETEGRFHASSLTQLARERELIKLQPTSFGSMNVQHLGLFY